MSSVINNVGISQKKLTLSLEKLGSGRRVNRAADDAAGLSISSKMGSDNTSLQQSIRNIKDGLSVLNTMESIMTTQKNLLVRMRELSVQALNETYNSTDLSHIRNEMATHHREFFRFAREANFNKVDLFDQGTTNTNFDLQIGIFNNSDNKLQLALSTDFVQFNSSLISVENLAKKEFGYAQILGSTAGAFRKISDAEEGLGYEFNGSTVLTAFADTDAATAFRDNVNDIILPGIDLILKEMDTRISSVGAFQNRLTHAYDEAINYSLSQQSSITQITDADMAHETSEMTQIRIMLQAGTSALNQMHQVDKSMINLL